MTAGTGYSYEALFMGKLDFAMNRNPGNFGAERSKPASLIGVWGLLGS